jgi:hypothetical protein
MQRHTAGTRAPPGPREGRRAQWPRHGDEGRGSACCDDGPCNTRTGADGADERSPEAATSVAHPTSMKEDVPARCLQRRSRIRLGARNAEAAHRTIQDSHPPKLVARKRAATPRTRRTRRTALRMIQGPSPPPAASVTPVVCIAALMTSDAASATHARPR